VRVKVFWDLRQVCILPHLYTTSQPENEGSVSYHITTRRHNLNMEATKSSKSWYFTTTLDIVINRKSRPECNVIYEHGTEFVLATPVHINLWRSSNLT